MPTTDKRPLKVFLCHAHADRDAVRALYTRLTNDGMDAWLDKEKLLPGQDWELEIKKAVREADVVVVCLSKQFNQAGFRQKEVRWALDAAMEQPENEIFIIPARLEECDVLSSLKKWHWVELFDEDGIRSLYRSLWERAKKTNAILPTMLRDSAIEETTLGNNNLEEISGIIRFAIIGKPGTGKSTTLNKLFNPDPKIPSGYFEKARWNSDLKRNSLIIGEREQIQFVNIPSPEDIIFIDESRLDMYKDSVAKCSAILWILKMTDLEFDIPVSFANYISSKNLVVGINQVDLAMPGGWSEEFNLPSIEQEENIRRGENVLQKTLKGYGVNPFAIISYSAIRNYHLTKLFRSIIDASPRELVGSLIQKFKPQSFLMPSS